MLTGNTPPGITDEMIEAGARSLAAEKGWDFYGEFVHERMRDDARNVLVAALAGRTVVDLPEPAEVRDDASFWRVEGRRIAASVDGCGNPLVLVDSQIWLVGETEAVGLALVAAAREARRLAAESSESDAT
jgi:hypothetical protein